MSYNTKLIFLENTGINYHRIIANFILDNLCKIYPPNTASVLVYGDKDLLISHLLSEKYLIHVANIGHEEPNLTHRIKIVDLDTFPLCEYDVIIGLFCDKIFIQNCITANNNFFIVPEYSLNHFTHNSLVSKKVPFCKKVFDAYMKNRTAFFNFNIKKL